MSYVWNNSDYGMKDSILNIINWGTLISIVDESLWKSMEIK